MLSTSDFLLFITIRLIVLRTTSHFIEIKSVIIRIKSVIVRILSVIILTKCDAIKNTSYRKIVPQLLEIFSKVFGRFCIIFLRNYSAIVSLYLLVEAFCGFSAFSSADKIRTISPLSCVSLYLSTSSLSVPRIFS